MKELHKRWQQSPWRRWAMWGQVLLLAYCVFAFSAGVLYFAVQQRSAAAYLGDSSPDRFFGDLEQPGFDSAAIIESGPEALRVRLQLIREAQASIDVSYHTLHSGTTAAVFFGSLLEAADRGVHVRIVMDGMLHRLFGSMRDVRYVLQLHPNIEYRFYEPLHWLRPWTWNNRLHDKLLIIDKEKAIISGRNMGNRYYLPGYLSGETTQDRDVLILNAEPERSQESAVTQMVSYFGYLWNSPFTGTTDLALNRRRRDAGATMREHLDAELSAARRDYPQYFADEFDWSVYCVPTKRVTLIHNPVQRGNKAPWIWGEITRLMNQAEHEVWVQSPYILLTAPMVEYLDLEHLRTLDIHLLTNSLASSPNMPAISGYLRNREAIAAYAENIWEYQGEGSLHGKAMLIDDHISIVGSFNVDPRSAFLSTETMLVIHGQEFNIKLRESLEEIRSQSLSPWPQAEVGSVQRRPVSWNNRMAAAVLRPLSRWFSFLL